MSYCIVYDRQVIKTPNGYTFAVLSGDNNVWEPGNRARAREWSCWLLDKSEKEVIDFFEGWCGREYQEHFKYNGKFLNDAELIRWVKSGMKRAKTIEEIRQLSGYSPTCSLSVWDKDSGSHWGRPECEKRVSTTEEFVAWIDLVKSRLANKKESETIYTIVSFSTKKPLRMLSMPDGPVILRRHNMYVSELGKDGRWKTAASDISKAMVFPDAATAKLAISGYPGDFRFEPAEKKDRELAKDHVIQIWLPGGNQPYYFQKSGRNRFWRTSTRNLAKRFDEQQAKKKAKWLSDRFTDLKFAAEQIVSGQEG